MKVFVTGATGYIGKLVVEELIAQDHAVIGLCRSEESASSLRKAGGTPLLGDLKQVDKLEAAAREADAVIHLGFVHDFENFDESVKVDVEAIGAFKKALAGSNKTYIGMSGSGTVGDTTGKIVDDTDPMPTAGVSRLKSEIATLEMANHNVKAMIMRLPGFVYGNNGSAFIPFAIEKAKKEKVVYYIGDGAGKPSFVHVEDTAHAIVLALTKGQAGAVYHPVSENNVTYKELAQAIGKLLELEVKSISEENAKATNIFGWLWFVFSHNNQLSSSRAQKGWKPKGVKVLEDVANGSYKASV